MRMGLTGHRARLALPVLTVRMGLTVLKELRARLALLVLKVPHSA